MRLQASDWVTITENGIKPLIPKYTCPDRTLALTDTLVRPRDTLYAGQIRKSTSAIPARSTCCTSPITREAWGRRAQVKMANEMIILSWKMGGYSWNYWLSEYGGETAVVLDGLKKIRDASSRATLIVLAATHRPSVPTSPNSPHNCATRDFRQDPEKKVSSGPSNA